MKSFKHDKIYLASSKFESTYKNKKPPFIKVGILSDVILVSNYHGCKGEAVGNTTLFDRYYSQNCKTITFRKINNHAKHGKINVPSHLCIF